jgi:Fe-S cluster biogenesis protein NfuA
MYLYILCIYVFSAGACDACSLVPKVLLQHMETDRAIAVWAVRAIADLAANNPNNQTKLGLNGACDGLVLALKSVMFKATVRDFHALDEITRRENITLAKWALWAVGNIIQLGRGTGGLIIDDDTKRSSSHTARSMGAQKNTTQLAEAGAAEAVTSLMMQYGEHDSEVRLLTD